MRGIEKRVDKLGRVVIPIKYRRRLGLKEHSLVLVSLDEDSVSITSAERLCALCGNPNEIDFELRICRPCIEKVLAAQVNKL